MPCLPAMPGNGSLLHVLPFYADDWGMVYGVFPQSSMQQPWMIHEKHPLKHPSITMKNTIRNTTKKWCSQSDVQPLSESIVSIVWITMAMSHHVPPVEQLLSGPQPTPPPSSSPEGGQQKRRRNAWFTVGWWWFHGDFFLAFQVSHGDFIGDFYIWDFMGSF